MSAAHWIVVGWMAFEAVSAITRIGKPRHALTPAEGAGAVVVWAIAVLLVVLG